MPTSSLADVSTDRQFSIQSLLWTTTAVACLPAYASRLGGNAIELGMCIGFSGNVATVYPVSPVLRSSESSASIRVGGLADACDCGGQLTSPDPGRCSTLAATWLSRRLRSAIQPCVDRCLLGLTAVGGYLARRSVLGRGLKSNLHAQWCSAGERLQRQFYLATTA